MAKKKKIIIKIISYILIFVLCVPVTGLGMCVKTAEAQDEWLHFTWQDNLLWGYTDNEDGTVTVGIKSIDFANVAEILADLTKYNQEYPKPAYVEIPKYLDGKLVTGVGLLAESTSIEAIVLPDSIINIYVNAFSFSNWGGLKSITIPSSVKYMAKGCISKKYNGVIYTTRASEAYFYAVLNGIKYHIIEEPDIYVPVTPMPVPSKKPVASLVPLVTEKPVIPTATPTIKPTATPTIKLTAIPTIKPTVKPTLKPVKTEEPVPEITNTPEVANTPKPQYTSKPDFIEIETPSPEPEFTPPPKPATSPEPENIPSLEPEYTDEPSENQKQGIEIDVNPLEARADAQGNFYDNKISISVTGTVSYNAEIKNASWLKICKENSLEEASEKITFTTKDYKNFYIFADKNTSASSRTGNIIITASNGERTETKSIKVKQEAAETKLSVSISKITANAKGDTSVSCVNVKTNGTGGFLADNCGYPWIKIGDRNSSGMASSSVSFKEEGNFYIFVSENTANTARNGKIKITHENGDEEEIITVSQEGRKTVLDVDTERKTADNKGVFYNNIIFVKTSGTGAFTVTVEDAEWLKLSSKNTLSFIDGMSTITMDKDSYIYLLADKNTGDGRTAVISVAHESGKITKEITVNQLGQDKGYLRIDRESAYFYEPGQGISESVAISANDSTKWTVTSSSDWIKIIKNNATKNEEYSSVEGTGNGKFYIMVKENNTYEERGGYVTISSPGLEDYEIYVYQVENEISIESLLGEVSIIVSKKTFKKGKTSKIKLDYPEGLYESDIKSVKFSSNKKKVATVSKKGVIKGIKKGKAVITIKITLENGSSKTFKAKVTVDKRKVKLSKFK